MCSPAVRAAFAQLSALPPPEPLDAVCDAIGHPPVSEDALRRSRTRVLGGQDTPATESKQPRRPRRGVTEPPCGQEFLLERHLANKSAAISGLFKRGRRHHVLARRGRHPPRPQAPHRLLARQAGASVESQRRRALACLNLDPAGTGPPIVEGVREVTNAGCFGMGRVERSLTNMKRAR